MYVSAYILVLFTHVANTIVYRINIRPDKVTANDPVGQVLARPLFLKIKTKSHFTKSKVISKSTRVIFGLVQLVIL